MKYFVSYFIGHNIDGNSGFGNNIIEVDKEIKSVEDLDIIKEFIENDHNFRDVIILYYQKML